MERSEITLLLKTTAINYKSGASRESTHCCCWIIIKKHLRITWERRKKLNIKQQPANKLAPLLLSTFVIKAEESKPSISGHSYAYFIYSRRALKAVLSPMLMMKNAKTRLASPCCGIKNSNRRRPHLTTMPIFKWPLQQRRCSRRKRVRALLMRIKCFL